MLDNCPSWFELCCIHLSPPSQALIHHRCGHSRPSHVISDLDDCLTPEKRVALDRLAPAPDDDDDVRHNAFRAMFQELCVDGMAHTFVDHVQCKCCPDNCNMIPFEANDGPNIRSGRPIRLWIAGSSCTDYSKRGHQSRAGGKTMRPFYTWAALVRRHCPHVVLHEITPDTNSRAILKETFSDMYDLNAA